MCISVQGTILKQLGLVLAVTRKGEFLVDLLPLLQTQHKYNHSHGESLVWAPLPPDFDQSEVGAYKVKKKGIREVHASLSPLLAHKG